MHFMKTPFHAVAAATITLGTFGAPVIAGLMGLVMEETAMMVEVRDSAYEAAMVPVFVGVQNLADGPAVLLRSSQTFFIIEGINRERLTGFRAGNQVVVISPGVAGPDLFNVHSRPPLRHFNAAARR